MAKQMLTFFVLAYLVGSTVSAGYAPTPPKVDKKLAACRTRASKLCGPSSLTFYLHNTLYDATLNNTDTFNSLTGVPPSMITPPFLFGTRITFEDPLTKYASPKSKNIGTAQGFYLFDSLKERLLFHIFTANITSGPYTGSITIIGQVSETSPVRVLSVAGGTGAFLGVHGAAYNKLVTFSAGPPVSWTNSYVLDLYY